MARLLLIHHEPIECQVIADRLRATSDAAVEVTSTATQGALMIAGGDFDLALINTAIPNMPDIRLVALAVSHNTPLLWLSDNPSTSMKLRGLGYTYLERPLDLEILAAETWRIIQEAQEMIKQVAETASKMELQINTLKAEIAQCHRLFDRIMDRLGYKDAERAASRLKVRLL